MALASFEALFKRYPRLLVLLHLRQLRKGARTT